MYIRLLYGPKNGEVVDMENSTALELMRQKRAENPWVDPVPVVAAESEPAQSAPRKKKRA